MVSNRNHIYVQHICTNMSIEVYVCISIYIRLYIRYVFITFITIYLFIYL